MPRGYEKEDPAGTDGEGWRISQKNRQVDMMKTKYADEAFEPTLVGSRSMGDALMRTSKMRKSAALSADAVLVAGVCMCVCVYVLVIVILWRVK
jgi:hypothetical protein